MERKDTLGLLAVLVAAGVLLYREGREVGGVTPDPIIGTMLVYTGLTVAGVGSLWWLWLACQPLWRKPGRPIVGLSFRAQYREVYKGNLFTAQLNLRCRRRVTVESVRVRCSAPAEVVECILNVYRDHDLMPPSHQLQREQPTTEAATYDLVPRAPILLPRRSQVSIYVQGRHAISIKRVWVRNRWWRL